MQPSTTDMNHERIPYKLNVFLFGHEHTQSRNVKQFHKYSHTPIGTNFCIEEESDDDEHLILSGRICLFYVCKCVLQFFRLLHLSPYLVRLYINTSLFSLLFHTLFLYSYKYLLSTIDGL
jgi:hypothetical protein